MIARERPSLKTALCVYDLTPKRIGGMEAMARALCTQLAERGWRTVLCFRAHPSDEVREFLDQPHVQLDVLPSSDRGSVSGAMKFGQLVARYRPHIVHLHFLDFLSPFARVAKWRGAHRVFVTDHISRDERYVMGPFSLLKRTAYKCAVPVSKVICVSDYVRCCWLSSRGISESRLCTIYNGVDIDRCQQARLNGDCFRRQHGIPSDRYLVSQVASMIPEKGFMTLLRAAQIVIRRRPDVHFVLAGEGRDREHYQRFVAQEGMSSHVTFSGLVADPICEGLFAATDIVCQMSNWNEAFGLVIAEAMASGKPVIGSRVGGIPELIEDGVSGYLVERQDVAALADKILYLTDHSGVRQRMGAAGFTRCSERFHIHQNVERTVALYEQG